jgi:hypothetical protein
VPAIELEVKSKLSELPEIVTPDVVGDTVKLYVASLDVHRPQESTIVEVRVTL